MIRGCYGIALSRYLAIVMIVCLAACTAVHPPQPILPSRDSITAGETITVQGSQNIYGIARANNVSMREIIVLNNLHPPFALKPGQQLVLPAGGSSPVVSTGDVRGQAPSPQSAPEGAVETTELAPPPPSAIQTAPLDQKPDQKNNAVVAIAPVEALNAPSAPPNPVATTVKPAAPAQVATGNPESITAPVVPPPPNLPEPSKPAAAAVATAAATSASTATLTMVWPLQGPILSAFGDKGAGFANDGINIGAPKGAPVVAAAGGTVVYVGNEMKGFGNLILIRHEQGWITAYAHLDRTLVTKDAIVAQGDMIGTVGKTGNVPSPQLHFETRHDGKPVDPRSLIKG